MPIKRSIALMMSMLAAGCAELPSISPGLDTLPGEPVQLVRLQEYFPAYNSGFEMQARLVVTSQAEWEATWQRIWQNTRPVPAPPAVDFQHEVVLVAAMGSRSSGGHHIQLQQAAAQPGNVVVRVVETFPGEACVVTAAITEPVDVVRLPRTSQPIQFQTVKQVHACD
ncbi:protease complex subunit PrcB family protein [Longimicrobium sp.]|uniref:protease complex subunit PrcB family protein n=1 Tax=Longimicrobium sp. TaxID=2029185 RepID=UPI003B3B62FF